jgi:anthranilate phosphoribosyltransferase
MMIKEALASLIEGKNLTEGEMIIVMDEIMSGGATQAQIGAFLVALRIKGETVDEITGAARVMREKAMKITSPAGKMVVDTCGTGGDGSGTFNISTTAAFIAAGAGVVVAKHGNKSVSSKSGSADMLQQLGVNVEAEVEKVEECLRRGGIGFLFAPMLHGAMKHAIGPRREIGVRTIFNLLGPLTNPAGASHQVIGVYSDTLTEPVANVLMRLGAVHVFVVHGHDGLDEVTLTTTTRVSELRAAEVKSWVFDPKEYGYAYCKPADLKGDGPKENAEITLRILNGAERGPKRDIAVINAALAITAGWHAADIRDGIALANTSIDSGEALKRLELMREITNAK